MMCVCARCAGDVPSPLPAPPVVVLAVKPPHTSTLYFNIPNSNGAHITHYDVSIGRSVDGEPPPEEEWRAPDRITSALGVVEGGGVLTTVPKHSRDDLPHDVRDALDPSRPVTFVQVCVWACVCVCPLL